MKLIHASVFVVLGATSAFAKFEKPSAATVPARQPASAPATSSAPSSQGAAPAAPAGRIVTQTYAFTQKNLGPKGYLKGDQIGGCCLLQQTRIRIETLEGKTVHEETLQTFETFTLSGLKANETYNMILINPRYKVALKLEKVRAGNWINFRGP